MPNDGVERRACNKWLGFLGVNEFAQSFAVCVTKFNRWTTERERNPLTRPNTNWSQRRTGGSEFKFQRNGLRGDIDCLPGICASPHNGEQ